jgi:hypothetical protein
MIPYLLPPLRRPSQFVAFVLSWVTKQLTFGIIQKIKIRLAHPVFRNAKTNLDHLIVPTSIRLTTIQQINLPTLPLLHLLASTVINPIVLKLTFSKKQEGLRNKTNSQANLNEAADVILVAAPTELGLATSHKLSDTIFIGDSGATCHMRF